MKILNRFSGAVIFEDESVSVLFTLYASRKSGANLIDANLRGADFSGANLIDANLEGEVLTKAPVWVLNLKWPVLITEEYMRIGCQRYIIDEWKNFNDDQIKVMASEALEFWHKWKAPLLAICETHCVKSIT